MWQTALSACGVLTTVLVLVTALYPLSGCDLPRDPEGTLEQARGGTLRVGVCPAEPYVIDTGTGDPAGIEAELIRGFAESIDATVVWERGTSDDLLHRLESFELDAVICGLTDRSPWSSRLALSRPYERQPRARVIALAPGENAMLAAFDGYLADRRGQTP